MVQKTSIKKTFVEEEKDNKAPRVGILLVEDDQFLSSIIAERLEREGFEVTVVGNGIEAMKQLEKEIPDLVLLDIIMPGMNGFDVLRAIKCDDRLKHTLVIFFSNVFNEHDIEEGRKLGVDDFWIKARFSPKEVAEKVGALVRAKASVKKSA